MTRPPIETREHWNAFHPNALARLRDELERHALHYPGCGKPAGVRDDAWESPACACPGVCVERRTLQTAADLIDWIARHFASTDGPPTIQRQPVKPLPLPG